MGVGFRHHCQDSSPSLGEQVGLLDPGGSGLTQVRAKFPPSLQRPLMQMVLLGGMRQSPVGEVTGCDSTLIMFGQGSV